MKTKYPPYNKLKIRKGDLIFVNYYNTYIELLVIAEVKKYGLRGYFVDSDFTNYLLNTKFKKSFKQNLMIEKAFRIIENNAKNDTGVYYPFGFTYMQIIERNNTKF